MLGWQIDQYCAILFCKTWGKSRHQDLTGSDQYQLLVVLKEIGFDNLGLGHWKGQKILSSKSNNIAM